MRKRSRAQREWDVVIVGAGPAGLSAALILGRCRRSVLICDRGTPRNASSHALYAYLSRDGIDPRTFRRTSWTQIRRYPSVKFRAQEVVSARRIKTDLFEVAFRGGQRAVARKLLLASGVADQLPSIPGIAPYYGKSVFPCPYCDGWEMRDQGIAVYGKGARGFEMARAMTAWSSDILVCTDGGALPSQAQCRDLAANGIAVERARIVRLGGRKGRLQRIFFADGSSVARRALFFDTPSRPQCDLARQLQCGFTAGGGIRCGQYEASSVPGVFVAGNILRDVQLSIVAAAEGARAAFGINRALTRETFERRAGHPVAVEHPGPAG